jgi:hypothetical protein
MEVETRAARLENKNFEMSLSGFSVAEVEV